jgi:hypothetical protein
VSRHQRDSTYGSRFVAAELNETFDCVLLQMSPLPAQDSLSVGTFVSKGRTFGKQVLERDDGPVLAEWH